MRVSGVFIQRCTETFHDLQRAWCRRNDWQRPCGLSLLWWVFQQILLADCRWLRPLGLLSVPWEQPSHLLRGRRRKVTQTYHNSTTTLSQCNPELSPSMEEFPEATASHVDYIETYISSSTAQAPSSSADGSTGGFSYLFAIDATICRDAGFTPLLEESLRRTPTGSRVSLLILGHTSSHLLRLVTACGPICSDTIPTDDSACNFSSLFIRSGVHSSPVHKVIYACSVQQAQQSQLNPNLTPNLSQLNPELTADPQVLERLVEITAAVKAICRRKSLQTKERVGNTKLTNFDPNLSQIHPNLS